MPSVTTSQLTLNFEPTLPERFGSLRAYIAFKAQAQAKALKVIAADMDMSPSMLSRKLNPGEGDTQRFNLDDLEGYIQSTGDCASVVEYLVVKYMDSDDAKQARLMTHVAKLTAELEKTLAMMQPVAERTANMAREVA